MKGTRKGTILTVLAVMISTISLVTCFNILSISNAYQGTSIKEKKVWDLRIDNVSELAMDIGAIEVLKEPTFDKFKANYGVKLIRPNSNAQFEFTLKNDGNIDAKITDIKITGIESYKNFVDISFVNLAVGDVIKEQSITSVKVILKYHTQKFDEELNPQEILLNNINIDIKLEKIE